MPRYEIEIPGKGKFEVDSPTPLTDQQAYAAVLQQLQAAPAAPVAAPTTAGDIFTALKTGALGSAKALTDVFGADNAASAALAKKLEAAQKEYSPARQAEMAREAEERKKAAESGSMLEEAKVFGRQVLESPLQATAGAVGSFAPYLPTMLLGPITTALGLGARGVAAATAVANAAPKYIATAQGAGAVKGAMYDAVYEAEKKDGASEDAARQKASEAQAYFGKNIDQIAFGAGLGRVAGGSGIERLLTKEGAEKAAVGLLPRVGRAVGVEAATEAPQGAQEQFAANLALQRTGREQPLMQGVLGAGIQEGLMGALGAAPVAALRGGPAAEELRRKQFEERARAEQQLAAEERARQEELARMRQQPEYLDDLQRRYDDLVRQETEFKNALKIKPEGTDPASVEIARRSKKETQEKLKEFQDSEAYKDLVEEYIKARPLLAGRQREQARVEEVFGKEPTYEAEDLSPAAQAKKFQDQIDALRKQQAKLTTPAEKQPLENQIYDIEQSLAQLAPTDQEYREAERRLNKRVEDSQLKLTTATSTADMQRLTADIDRTNAALEELRKLQPFVKTVTRQPTLREIQDQVDAAQAKGDVEALQRLTPMLAEAERQPELPFATGYESENQLAEEIARAREEAAKRRQAVEQETAALFRIGTKELSPLELGLRKARLDEARATLKAVTKPTGRQVSKGIAYQVTPAGKPTQATEVAKLVRANEQDWASFDKELKEGAPRRADRDRLENALKNKQKELLADVEKFTEFGPSPALQLLRAELDAVEKALADVKRKNALLTQAQKPTKKVAGVALKPSETQTLELGRYTGAPGMDLVLSEESDKRVADLIDRLLPLATARSPEDQLVRPLEGQTPSLFDIDAQKGIAKAAKVTELPQTSGPRVAQTAPIEDAARLLEELAPLPATLKRLNEEIERAGSPRKPEKVAALEALKNERDAVAQRIEAIKNRYNRLSQLRTPSYDAEQEQPSAEDLFAPLEESRAQKNQIQKQLDKLYERRKQLRGELQRRGQLGETPALQQLVDFFSKETSALQSLETEIAALEGQLSGASRKTDKKFQEFASAREQERKSSPETQDTLAELQKELTDLRNASPQMKEALGDRYSLAIRSLEAKIEELSPDAQRRKAPDENELTPQQRVALNKRLEDAQEKKEDAYFDLAHFYQNEGRGQAAIAKARDLRTTFLNSALTEVEMRRELAGFPPLSNEYRQDLRQLLSLVLDDLARLQITRNEDNSYDYSEVNGFVGVQKQPIVGAVTPEQAADLQNELQDLRTLRISLDQRIAEIADIERGKRKTPEELNAALSGDAPAFKAIRARYDSVSARINEVTALIDSYVRGEGLETVVIEGKTQGSDAPLEARALGAKGAAVGVLEDQANELVLEFAKDRPVEQTEVQEPLLDLGAPAEKEPRQPPQRTLAGFARRTFKPVDPAAFQQARAAYVEALTKLEALSKAISKIPEGSKFFQETTGTRLVAAQEQLRKAEERVLRLSSRVATLQADPKNADALARVEPLLAEATAELEQVRPKLQATIARAQNRLLVANLAPNTGLAKLQKQFRKAETAVSTAREKVLKLEQQQRAFEQQEDVRTNALPGSRVAARITTGERENRLDLENATTPRTRAKPKNLKSWGVVVVGKRNLTPVAPAKVAATSNMVGQYQREAELAAQTAAEKQETLEYQLAKATKNLENLSNAVQQVYPVSVAKATEDEIASLLAAGLTPEQLASVRNMVQVYGNLKNSVAGNTAADVIARLEAERDRLMQQPQISGRRGSVAEEKENKKRENTTQTQLNELGEMLRKLKAVPAKTDPWVAAFNALIAETNTNTLIAAQNVSYAQYGLDSVEQRLTAFVQQAQQKIDEIMAEPESAGKKLKLANARELLDRATQRQTVNNNAYNTDLEKANAYRAELETAQAAYQKARLEQLNLLKAYGQDLQKNVLAEAERISALTPQIQAQAKLTAETQEKLNKANQLLAAQKVQAREAATPPATTPPFVYSKDEKAALARIREGLGLPGVRYETDTTGKLVTLTRKAVRDTLTLARSELVKAQAANDVPAVQRATQRIQDLERDYEQVMEIGERVVTPVGEGAAEVERTTVDVALELKEEQERLKKAKKENNKTVIADVEKNITSLEKEFARLTARLAAEGTRLGRRRVGAVVRVGTQPPSQMLSGTAESREAISKGNRPAQAGKVRLMASDLDPTKASAVSLAVLDQQRKAATGERKKKLDEAYTAATNGLAPEQVRERIKEGNDLIKVPGAATVVAARERVRAAWAEYQKAETDLKKAATPAAKEIAADLRDTAEQAWMLAEENLKQAQAAVAAGFEPNVTTKKVVEDAIDESFGKDRASKAIEEGEPDEGFASIKRAELETLPTDAVAELIKDGQVQAALEQLAADSKSDLIRRNARDLAPFVLRTKVKFDPNLTHRGKPVPALYVPEENTIYFRPDEVTEENIVHEAAHAASMRVLLLPDSELTDRQRNAKKELEAIFKTASKNKELVGQYGLDNIKEFVSEMQANEEFRALADKQPWYKRFWHAITRLFSRAPMETVSQQADRLIREIYAPSRVITKAEAAPSIFRSKGPSSVLIGREAGALETVRGNLFGLSGRVQFFDKLGAADEALIRAKNAGALSDYEAFQTQYYLRLSDMTSQAAGQFITNGPVRIVSQDVAGLKEYRYESVGGANLSTMSGYMEQAANAGLGTPEEVENIVTVLIAGERANALTNGWKRLFADDPEAARAEYNSYQTRLRASPEAAKFVNLAKEEYRKYNDGLLDFAEQTGFLSPEEVRRLKRLPYVPYYRIEDGVVKLYTDSESWVRIGNIKDNPDLQRMVGDNKKILPILTSAAQNTFMLTRMSLRNKATQETANALFKAGFATKIGKGAGPANVNTVHYKVKGENHFAVIDSDQYGVPADLIVKGMEGIRTTIPMIVQAMGLPADWIRKFVTRSPAYVIRQLIRDPINSAIVSGVDGVPVLNALKQMGKMATTGSPEADALQRGLIVNSNVFTGDERDMELFLRSVATGRGKWAKMMSAFDNVAYMTDAATRATIYTDSINKGMSEARAQFRALESQNFSRRGLSPTMQWLNMMVPFFNAQIQGLDVLYRASRGKLPFNEQLDIRKKLIARGMLLIGTAVVYALAMHNDEDYMGTPPEQRYANFFVRVSGFKEPVKVPIPYEVGLIFKALPEALMDAAFTDTKAKDAAFGWSKLAWQSVPGVVPAAPKPIIEAIYGKTLFGPIESAREKMLEAPQRFRETTPEVLKMLGGITGLVGVSPLMLEHFVRSYTAALGVSVLRVFDPVLRSGTEGAKASEGESKLPFVGGLFQSTDGRFLRDRAYDRMTEIQQAAETYKDLMKRGKQAEAREHAQRRADLLAAETMAGIFRQSMGQKFADERGVRAAPNLTQAQKDALLERIKASQRAEAKAFYQATERTTPR